MKPSLRLGVARKAVEASIHEHKPLRIERTITGADGRRIIVDNFGYFTVGKHG